MLMFKKIFICVTILIYWSLWRNHILQDYEIEKIRLRCKELNVSFNNIVGVVMSRSSYKKIMDILSLKEWNEAKFQPLLTSTIWQSNYDNIKKILSMEEWNDSKFQPLLTSSIWNSNYGEIKDILEMKEWNDSKYQPLLTSTIWNSNYENIKNILEMEEWNDSKYAHLLSTSILPLNSNKIRQSIALAHKFNVNGYITVNFMRKPLKQIYAIAAHLEHLKISLITENGKLHPFFNYQTTTLKEKYNIDLKILTKLYPMPNDFLESEKVK